MVLILNFGIKNSSVELKFMLSENDKRDIIIEMGEVSANKLYDLINSIKDGILVDIGVYAGNSSKMMISNSSSNNNIVYGIDPCECFDSTHPNYKRIKDDSVEYGKQWNNGLVDLVFFDSVHAKEQVLCELYYWWDKIKEGGYGCFHDTSWKDYIHKPYHSAAGKLTGNTAKGYDSYGGIDWETPDKAVEQFFRIELNGKFRDIENNSILDIYEDEFIKVQTNYACMGMTFITKKKHYDYRTNIDSWDEIFNKQKILVSFFK